MNRAFFAAAFICSLTLAAQNSPRTTTRILPLNSLPGACPIDMYARQGVWDHTIRIREGEHQQSHAPFGQRIFLTLVDKRPVQIVAATIIVRGLTGKNRVLQTAGSANDFVAARIIRATFTKQPDGSVSADIYVPGLTSVTSLELQDVSFADGSTRKFNSSSMCRVAPDPFMLVAAH